MTVDQIAKMRDYNLQDDGTSNPIASVFAYIFNNELAYVNTRDFVITDDDNQLIHAIKPNIEDPVNQARYPFKIMTGFYGNIQYVEALYDMNNFKRAVKDLFTDSGLINQDQENMIMKWASGIRNQTVKPKQPGPYFKDTIMPIPKQPVEERRSDGLHHASPIDQVTLTNKLDNIVVPLIEGSDLDAIKLVKNRYKIVTKNVDDFPAIFKSIIEGVGKDLYMASLADAHGFAMYNPSVPITMDLFIEHAKELMPNKKNTEKGLVLYVEAFNVRTEYYFDILFNIEDPIKWSKEISSSINSFLSGRNDLNISGSAISATINSSVSASTVQEFVNFANTLDIEKVTFKLGNASLEYKTNKDPAAFIEGVINAMPDVNGSTLNGSVAAVSATGASVVYTLKVKYYNEAECPCKIGDTFYTTLAEAFNVGVDIVMQNDTAEDVTVPAGKTVNLNLNGHTISNKSGHTIVNNGTLIISGEGTIDNITHAKASIYTTNGASTTILSGNITRSQEAGVSKNNNGGNSYYVIRNEGTTIIGAEGAENNITVIGDGKYSSLICNEINDTTGKTEADAAHMIIYGGTFNGGLNTVKNGDLASMEIYGGTFINYAQHSLLNWNTCLIAGGTFQAIDLPVIANGEYGDAHGDLTITNGVFESGSVDCLTVVTNYPCTDIKVSGGTFSSDPSAYVTSGYLATANEAGKYVVTEKPAQQVAEEEIDSFLEGLDYEGVIVEADPDTNNTYNILTSTGSITDCGLIDTVASINGMTSIVVSNGTDEVTYTAGEDLEVFKAQVDALVPQNNTAEEVIFTMTVNM